MKGTDVFCIFETLLWLLSQSKPKMILAAFISCLLAKLKLQKNLQRSFYVIRLAREYKPGVLD